jgi:hypothetical protein
MKQQETKAGWREWRRLIAWALKQQGWKQKDITEALGHVPLLSSLAQTPL